MFYVELIILLSYYHTIVFLSYYCHTIIILSTYYHLVPPLLPRRWDLRYCHIIIILAYYYNHTIIPLSYYYLTTSILLSYYHLVPPLLPRRWDPRYVLLSYYRTTIILLLYYHLVLPLLPRIWDPRYIDQNCIILSYNHTIIIQSYYQGCINRRTCSHPELTQDQVLTSAYVIIFCTVATNAVNKSVWRKKDCSWLPFNKHAKNVSLLFSFRSLPVTFDLVDRSMSCQYGTHAPI